MHDLEGAPRRVSAFVHVSQRFGHVDADGERFGPADTSTELLHSVANLAEVAPLHVLDHYEGLTAPVVGGFEDLRDPRVLQLRLDPSLVEEASQERAVAGVLATDDLHDAGSLGSFDGPGGGQEDLPHAATGHQPEQREAAEPARQHLPRLAAGRRIIARFR